MRLHYLLIYTSVTQIVLIQLRRAVLVSAKGEFGLWCLQVLFEYLY